MITIQTATARCRLVMTLIVLTTLSTLSGCSVFGPDSQARKIGYEAIGSDSPLDKASNKEHQQRSKLFGRAASLGVDYEHPGTTLSGFTYEALSVNILAIALDIATPDRNERTFIYGWMPRDEAQTLPQAVDKVENIEKEATLSALDDMEIEYEMVLDKKMDQDDPEAYHRNFVYILKAPEYGCDYLINDAGKKDSNCAVTIRSGFLTRATAPEFAPNAHEPVWELTFASGDGPVVRFINNETQLPTVDLHQKISEHLPEWAYMFMPDSPNYIVINKNAQFKGYPYWLNQGKELHFITPLKSG